jgi:LuxR family quorum sensing-dependent transcriptional regulator
MSASSNRLCDLSKRERECMRWVAAGRTDQEIAALMGLAASTVRFHIDRARRKLGARTRSHAVAMMLRQQLF